MKIEICFISRNIDIFFLDCDTVQFFCVLQYTNIPMYPYTPSSDTENILQEIDVYNFTAQVRICGCMVVHLYVSFFSVISIFCMK